MIFPSQTLVREISNPTLPAYVTSCINLFPSKASGRALAIPFSFQEAVFRSFVMLIPRHAGIFKPFSSQIRSIINCYIVPSCTDIPLIPLSLKQSARYLFISLLETSPKSTYSDQWGKATRDLIKNIHLTADQVFRAIIEDWESSVGYVCQPVDVSKQPQGGDINGYLTPWIGIEAGADKLVGLLEFLTAFFKIQTPESIKVPLGTILDLVDRVLSILTFPKSEPLSAECPTRFVSSIGKDEKNSLHCRLPSIYTAMLHLIITIAERIGENFIPLASDIFEKLVCVFPFGKHNDEFQQTSFDLLIRILLIIGKGLQKDQVDKLSGVIDSCCEKLLSNSISPTKLDDNGTRGKLKLSNNKNADSIKYCQKISSIPTLRNVEKKNTTDSASRLLPHLLSDLPQNLLDISTRSRIERVAILRKNKKAMVACVLNPFIGPCDKELSSILPHIARAFASDEVVEILLRPRMPQISVAANPSYYDNSKEDDYMQEETSLELGCPSLPLCISDVEPPLITTSLTEPIPKSHADDGSIQCESSDEKISKGSIPITSAINISLDAIEVESNTLNQTNGLKNDTYTKTELSSDEESVHFTMELDTDSE